MLTPGTKLLIGMPLLGALAGSALVRGAHPALIVGELLLGVAVVVIGRLELSVPVYAALFGAVLPSAVALDATSPLPAAEILRASALDAAAFGFLGLVWSIATRREGVSRPRASGPDPDWLLFAVGIMALERLLHATASGDRIALVVLLVVPWGALKLTEFALAAWWPAPPTERIEGSLA